MAVEADPWLRTAVVVDGHESRVVDPHEVRALELRPVLHSAGRIVVLPGPVDRGDPTTHGVPGLFVAAGPNEVLPGEVGSGRLQTTSTNCRAEIQPCMVASLTVRPWSAT